MRHAWRGALLGATMVGMLGCAAPPTEPQVQAPQAAAIGLAERQALRDGAPKLEDGASAYELQQRRGRRYRHRRIVVRGVPYYVPYFAYQSHYLPDYQRYDTDWYYVYAYTGPNFSGSRRLIRIRRDRDRDRDWNDRRDWNRGDGDDWRDGDRDDDRFGDRGDRGFGDRNGRDGGGFMGRR